MRSSSLPDAEPLHLILEFLLVPAGGAVVGFGLARVCAMLFTLVRNNRLVLVSVTLAFRSRPWSLLFCSASPASSPWSAQGLHLPRSARRGACGCLAVCARIWEQLAFWASSLLFVLAAFAIPRLLESVDLADLAAIVIVVVMALASRAVVLFAFCRC